MVPATALPPLSEAFESGWFDATFPNACDTTADAVFGHDVMAQAASFRMAAGHWSQGFNLLFMGLSAGHPDASEYQLPFTALVEYGMTRHKEMHDSIKASVSVSSWAGGPKASSSEFGLQPYQDTPLSSEDAVSVDTWTDRLKALFVLQAQNLRYSINAIRFAALLAFSLPCCLWRQSMDATRCQ